MDIILIQSNLSIAEILYNGHLIIADTFLRNQPNHGQTLTEKPLNSGHLFWAPGEHFGQNLPPNSGHLMTGWKNGKYMDVFVWHISLP